MPPLAHHTRLLGLATLVVTLAIQGSADAQNSPAEDVDGAARAFEEGQRAQLHRDYVRAAELFELADRAAPSAAALRSAMRNFDASGNGAHAATLAARAIERYPSDPETRKLAEHLLAKLAPSLGQLDVRCAADCALVLDGRATSDAQSATHKIYVTPGEHAVLARFNDGRSATQSVTATAGATSELAVEPPPVVATPTPPPVSDAPPAATVTPAPALVAAPVVEKPDHRLNPALAIVGFALTAGLGGATLWSGLDTLSANDRYQKSPTQAGFNDGVGREHRTDGLIAGTAALGVVSLAIALFATRWHQRAPAERRAAVRLQSIFAGGNTGRAATGP